MTPQQADIKLKKPIVIIVLAAGSSTRMGQSKQLLPVLGQPLLLKTTNAAQTSEADHTIVVLGAQHDLHQKILEELPVTIVDNPDWEKGMGNSLKAGLNQALRSYPEMQAALIMVCDQPLVTDTVLNMLIQKYTSTQAPIIASAYGNTIGVPALFDKSIFAKLLTLRDEHGAKKIMSDLSALVLKVDFPGGEIDLDTPEEYRAFIR
jgi:molybdenum cofactor cytidylyltransferase